jgi:hypothetical protein
LLGKNVKFPLVARYFCLFAFFSANCIRLASFFAFFFVNLPHATAMLLLLSCFFPLPFSERVGKAGPAEFKSQPEGEAETSYLVEWTSLSYTPITEFKLEVKPEAGQWVAHNVPATEA